MDYVVKLNNQTFEEILSEENTKELLKLAGSAKIIIHEPAFDQAFGDMVQELYATLVDPATSDEEANILRRSINVLSAFKVKLKYYAEQETQYKPVLLEAEEVIK